MKKPRITGHQLQIMYAISEFESGKNRWEGHTKCVPKSWINSRGVRVWRIHPHGMLNVLGDPWDTQTGESLLKKGIIEPSFAIDHDGGYDAPDGHYRYARGKTIQFYKLTELGRSYLN